MPTSGYIYACAQPLKSAYARTRAQLRGNTAWKPHITRIARKATVALLQCRQIVGRAWGLNPTNMQWIYTAMIRPVITYACISWVGGVNKKYLAKKLSKVQRLACLMISSALPSTPTGALEMLVIIMPINEFIMSEAVKGLYRISQVKFWPAKTIGSIRKTKSHNVCNEAYAKTYAMKQRKTCHC